MEERRTTKGPFFFLPTLMAIAFLILIFQTWKKRWFVLRPAHLAYYKTSAEYQLLKILDLGEVHSCTAVSLKKHDNTFGLVSPVRTFYLRANSPDEVQGWVRAIQEARETLMATSTIQSISTPPIPIPGASGHRRTGSHPPPVTPSPASQRSGAATSSDSEDHDGSPNIAFSQTRQGISSSPSKALSSIAKDPNKVVLSGYLMKCGSKRHNWRKRWFVLNGEKLIYSGSHMVSCFFFRAKLVEILKTSRIQSPIANLNFRRFWMHWSTNFLRIGSYLLHRKHRFPTHPLTRIRSR